MFLKALTDLAWSWWLNRVTSLGHFDNSRLLLHWNTPPGKDMPQYPQRNITCSGIKLKRRVAYEVVQPSVQKSVLYNHQEIDFWTHCNTRIICPPIGYEYGHQICATKAEVVLILFHQTPHWCCWTLAWWGRADSLCSVTALQRVPMLHLFNTSHFFGGQCKKQLLSHSCSVFKTCLTTYEIYENC